MSRAAEPFEFVVGEREAGERLDRAITLHCSASRSEVQRWIEEERVHIDGVIARSSAKMKPGARVAVAPSPPPPTTALPENIPIRVLFEDEHLLVVDKPAGLVVHPAPGHASGTLVNAVLHHTKIEDDDSPQQRPGIVHRLDRDTSGTMVIAKTVPAREGLTALFQAHDIGRIYTAIVVGELRANMTFDTLHGRHPTDRKRFSGKVLRGKRAITHVTVLQQFHGATLVQCKLETGRTHQIRVHLSENGTPLLADAVYGKPSKVPELRDIGEALGRHALHAGLLAFTHPITKEPLRFVSELPSDMAAAIAALLLLK